MASENDSMKEKALQEKFMEYQTLQQQISQMHRKLQQVAEQKAELASVMHGVSGIAGVSAGSPSLVPVASGIFARASIVKSDTLLVNVGSNVVVEKSFGEVMNMLGRQSDEIGSFESRIASQLGELVEKFGRVEKEMEQMISEAKKDV